MQVTGLSALYRILTIVVLLSGCVWAQNYPDTKIHNKLNSGLHQLLSQNYDAAEHEFKDLYNRYPNLPLGCIYLAAVKIAETADFEEEFNDSYIMSNLNHAEKMSRKLISQDNKNPWNHYFLAITKGYMAYYKALKENYVAAFSDGMSSISSFEKCLALDSSFYEAYIALGAYKYWKSEKTEYFHWLPFLKDERAYGIKLLNRAVRHKSYNHYLALNSLIWIYINKNQSQKAAEIALKGLKGYPSSRFFRWGLARAYQDFNRDKAISEYWKLLNSVHSSGRNNRVNEVILKHKLAMLYKESGQNDNALNLCNEILSIKDFKPYVHKKLEGRLKRVQELKKELSGN